VKQAARKCVREKPLSVIPHMANVSLRLAAGSAQQAAGYGAFRQVNRRVRL